MQEAQNTRVVQEAYAAFKQGDVESILNVLDDGIVWKGVYGAAPHVPTSGERKGKAQVREFFALVAQHANFSQFQAREFLADGDKVVALGHYTAKTSAGKIFDADFAMIFTFRSGKVIEFQEFTDSAAVNAAFM
jgi:ketosteroid isomerase-like protein